MDFFGMPENCIKWRALNIGPFRDKLAYSGVFYFYGDCFGPRSGVLAMTESRKSLEHAGMCRILRKNGDISLAGDVPIYNW